MSYPFDYTFDQVVRSFTMPEWNVRFDWRLPNAVEARGMLDDAIETHALTAAFAYIVLIWLVRLV